ncbi:MAG: AhpC/TSA family protein [Bacteroidaceae bacterium]|nr:AhpC/TSA family protein [Bacteroidaceae bacterium]
MKRILSAILLTLGGIMLSVASDAAHSDVIIKGKIGGIKSGRLLLVVQSGEQQVDTLASVAFKRSKFKLSTTIAEPLVATLYVEGYHGGFTFLAEPGVKYEAYLTNGDDFYIKGGALNDAYSAHMLKSDSMRAVIDVLQLRYDELKRGNKYRSASLTNDTLMRYRKEWQQMTNDFLSSHDDLITAYTLYSNIIMRDAGLHECRRIYDSMGPGAKATYCARMIKDRIERLEEIAENAPAPDFTAPDVNGDNIVMSAVVGKIKIIDFWASWCGPCRMNNPALKKLYAEFHDKGLEIVGVSLDNNRDKWLKAIKDDGLEWINVSTLAGGKCEIAKQYNVNSIPALFVLDENNRIIASGLRGEKLHKFISERLK